MSDTSPIVLLNLGSDILNSADQFSTINYYSGKLQVLAMSTCNNYKNNPDRAWETPQPPQSNTAFKYLENS